MWFIFNPHSVILVAIDRVMKPQYIIFSASTKKMERWASWCSIKSILLVCRPRPGCVACEHASFPLIIPHSSTSLVFCSFESESPFTSSVTWVCDRVGTTQLAQKAPSQTYFQVHNSSLEICLNASIKAQKIKRSAFYTHRAIRLGGSIN